MTADWKSDGKLPGCAICREVAHGKMPQELTRMCGVEYRAIMEDDEFLVIPSVSPLKLGHIMIVPKDHMSSMAQLPKDSVSRFLDLRQAMLERVRDSLGTVFCWEHGIGKCKEGGCGITHAHVHVLPMKKAGSSRLRVVLDEMFPLATTFECNQVVFKEIQGAQSYLYWEFESEKPQVVISDEIKSQLMRQLICQAEEMTAWDWRQYTNWDAFRETVQRFQTADA